MKLSMAKFRYKKPGSEPASNRCVIVLAKPASYYVGCECDGTNLPSNYVKFLAELQACKEELLGKYAITESELPIKRFSVVGISEMFTYEVDVPL